MNRIWQMLFGVGLVKSSENFGVQAEVPSHPELLDWLANEFVDLGWDTKKTTQADRHQRNVPSEFSGLAGECGEGS